MRFTGGIDGDVPDQKILAHADNIDALDVAAGLADRGRYFTEFSGAIVDLDSKGKAVAGVWCWCMAHRMRTPFHAAAGVPM